MLGQIEADLILAFVVGRSSFDVGYNGSHTCALLGADSRDLVLEKENAINQSKQSFEIFKQLHLIHDMKLKI